MCFIGGCREGKVDFREWMGIRKGKGKESSSLPGSLLELLPSLLSLCVSVSSSSVTEVGFGTPPASSLCSSVKKVDQ